jgi:glycosyltransferase involved in cell wall biosynthesis
LRSALTDIRNRERVDMRIFAALGGGDIVAAQRKELAGDSGVGQTSLTFSGQLYSYCAERGFHALFTSHCGRVDSLDTEWVRLANVPRGGDDRGGLRYHASRVAYGVKLARMARAFRADLALIDSGTTHYFALAAFRLLGIPVAVNFHNVRWPQGFEPTGMAARTLRAWDSWTFRHGVAAAMGCSPECGVQARADGATRLPYFGWCAQYEPEGFDAATVAADRNPFRLLFAGRVEENKGVFDLVRISQTLRERCAVPVAIEVCGDGSALAALRAAVATSTEADRIAVPGRLERAELLQAYRRAHAVIVPTRSTFCEGMPLVCAEAVLSGRPVVTSRLSNALPILGDAVAVAQPDDVSSYAEAVRGLAEDPGRYQRLRAACPAVAAQFLDRRRSYTAAVDQLITTLYGGAR